MDVACVFLHCTLARHHYTMCDPWFNVHFLGISFVSCTLSGAFDPLLFGVTAHFLCLFETNHCCRQGKSQNESHPVCQVVFPQKTTYMQMVRIENLNATQSLSYIRMVWYYMALGNQQEKHLFLLLYCYHKLLFKTLVCWQSWTKRTWVYPKVGVGTQILVLSRY